MSRLRELWNALVGIALWIGAVIQALLWEIE